MELRKNVKQIKLKGQVMCAAHFENKLRLKILPISLMRPYQSHEPKTATPESQRIVVDFRGKEVTSTYYEDFGSRGGHGKVMPAD